VTRDACRDARAVAFEAARHPYNAARHVFPVRERAADTGAAILQDAGEYWFSAPACGLGDPRGSRGLGIGEDRQATFTRRGRLRLDIYYGQVNVRVIPGTF